MDPILSMVLKSVPLWIFVLVGIASSVVAKRSNNPRVKGAAMFLAGVTLDVLKVLVGARQLIDGSVDAPDAKVLYQAYHRSAGGLNHVGQAMPSWEALPANIQENWRAAARAASENP